MLDRYNKGNPLALRLTSLRMNRGQGNAGPGAQSQWSRDFFYTFYSASSLVVHTSPQRLSPNCDQVLWWSNLNLHTMEDSGLCSKIFLWVLKSTEPGWWARSFEWDIVTGLSSPGSSCGAGVESTLRMKKGHGLGHRKDTHHCFLPVHKVLQRGETVTAPSLSEQIKTHCSHCPLALETN